MSKPENIQSQALREAIHLQEMEDNPLTVEEIAMFEMFEREGWSDEECLEHIRKRALSLVKTQAAE